MKIENDKISFEATEFDALSDFAKRALPVFVGEVVSFPDAFALELNSMIEGAKQNLANVSSVETNVDAVLKKLAASDPAKFDEVLATINKVLADVGA